MSLREMAVRGQFYPSSSAEIEGMFDHYNKILDDHFKDKDDAVLHLQPRAVIVPHAGYIYSGFTANIAHRLLKNSDLKRIVIIGPSHRVYLNGTSVAEYDAYDTPFGSLDIDKELVDELKSKFSLNFMPDAHREHSTEVQAPFLKKYVPDAKIVELVYGDEKPEDLSKVIDHLLKDESTAIVISTDLSHYYDIDKANRLDSICLEAVSKLNTDELHQGCETCGKIGVEAMILSSKKVGLKSVLLDYRTSADASGDKSSVVGYMSAAFIKKEKSQKEDVLLSLARASIAESLEIEHKVDFDELLNENEWLGQKGASFVTLNTKRGELRGCIGSIIAHRILYEDIIHNAKSAAFNDPRFASLSKDEFDDITVEVSILSEPERLEYDSADELRSKIKIGTDGVILKEGNYQATFLPQVWEQLPTFELFFSHLCQKAGLDGGCIERYPEIFVYQVEKYKED